jgi:DNA modification methylase
MPDTTLAYAPAHTHATVHLGDALHILTGLPDASVDAVITDPPYAIKKVPAHRFDLPAQPRPGCTDSRCLPERVCPRCLHAGTVEKFAQSPMLGQQSQNWHAKETHSRGYADNDPAQFQAWCALWLSQCRRVLKPGGHLVAFGGTRTWHRLATAAEEVGFDVRDSLAWLYSSGMPKSLNVHRALSNSASHDLQSSDWKGWGTTLKPAFEPIVLARRPLEGTMVENLSTWGVGPLNIAGADLSQDGDAASAGDSTQKWPTNVHLDKAQAARLQAEVDRNPANSFWISKPNRAERVIVDDVAHPTVKPLALMRRLVRLVTPHGGLVLDPFAGSGTTIEACLLEGMRTIGIERDAAYLPLIEERIRRGSLRYSPDRSTATEQRTAPTTFVQSQDRTDGAAGTDTLF